MTTNNNNNNGPMLQGWTTAPGGVNISATEAVQQYQQYVAQQTQPPSAPAAPAPIPAGTTGSISLTPLTPDMAMVVDKYMQKYSVFLEHNEYEHSSHSVSVFYNQFAAKLPDYVVNELFRFHLSPYHQSKLKKAMKLPDIQYEALPVKRRVTQPRFKLTYDTAKTFNLRLANSIIHVGCTPVYVREAIVQGDDIILVVENENRKTHKLIYNENKDIDLRTPEPQYVNMEGFTAHLSRPPIRQQVQGLHFNNSFITRVGTGERYHWENAYEIISALKNTEVVWWNPEYERMITQLRIFKSLRLSSNIAVYRDQESGDLKADYKGRFLGEIKKGIVSVDTRDFKQSWIRKELMMTGLGIGEAGGQDAR